MTPLEKRFTELGIDFTKIAFYDSLEFLQHEQVNPRFLEAYAEYVKEKKYSSEYFKRAAKEIPYIAKILNEELRKDGRLGACIDVSLVLGRILEREGFWNYLTKGSLTIDFPSESKIQTKYFWSVDNGDFESGHTWIVAPPFNVIDIALKRQVYKENEQDYLTNTILNTENNFTKVEEIDIISPVASMQMNIQGIAKDKLSFVRDDFFMFIKKFLLY